MFAVLLGVSITGCVPTDYQPDVSMAHKLGVEEARQRLRETLLRSVEPQVIEVSVTNEGLSYRYKEVRRVRGVIPFGPLGWGDSQEKLLAFTNVSKVDVFDNNVVYVRGAGGQVIAQIACASPQDARAFADLLMSLRTQYLQERAPSRAGATVPR
jgi:hypothetical protein